ncbi:hypothetical protein CcCBS67573_g06077 [Chytriomyces confervae]|uniref:U1-type domain-containing protein n=1 Tax=Chytriomyces confervae TaxID=246404 RepID=A0A507F7Q1_9FUNG|nr:hypothetical protein HDU80_006887 [Chytriomyces hyalinus]TPX71660.1 hypothetical protein CcCBS67573_g06077 [Chytriomyces confervae]
MSNNSSFYAGTAPGGDTGFRRTWDRDEYLQKAKERAEKGDPRKKDTKSDEPTQLLTQREGHIDFDALVNKTAVVSDAPGEQKQPGFFCAACNIVCKDNINYLDHLNGFKHQRNMGMSMKVERSTAEQVKARIALLTKKRKNPEPELNLAERVKVAVDAEEATKQSKKEDKKKKKEEKVRKEEADQANKMDPEMAAMMGFSGFGSSKK